MTGIERDPGSFRDPRGRVYERGGKIYRSISDIAAQDFEFLQASPVIRTLIADGKLTGFEPVEPDVLGDIAGSPAFVVEHPRVPFVSYPYEWSFATLKAAALLHLDIQLVALDGGISLSDASAYNVQFQGPNPVFIDLLSFRPYRDGELWTGHRQFCEQFLNPLLLRAKTGVIHNHWYRGSQEGITAQDLRRVLPWRSKLSPGMLLHVVAQAALQNSAGGSSLNRSSLKTQKLPKESYRTMLRKLQTWISTLEPLGAGRSTWQDYARSHSYVDDEVTAKKAFIRDFAAKVKPQTIWDIGCNSGDYSKAALEGGAKRAIGFDFDPGALELAHARAVSETLDFLPLMLDGANPSPSQGWNQQERKGLQERANADGVIALAYIHHIAIGRNVPLDDVISWLVGLAPQGVIEFVPKKDPMVIRLLELRDDIFTDYEEDVFLKSISSRARIIREEVVTQNGRKLVWFDRS
jgi:ribosomal protein L11 methylase PrmA